jgi:hypothetical protein
VALRGDRYRVVDSWFAYDGDFDDGLHIFLEPVTAEPRPLRLQGTGLPAIARNPEDGLVVVCAVDPAAQHLLAIASTVTAPLPCLRLDGSWRRGSLRGE